MKHRLTVEFTFEAAHRLMSAYSQECVDTIHGHSYRVQFDLFSYGLNDDDMVVDFKKVKEKLGKFIKTYDHSLILHHDDPLLHYDLIVQMPKLNVFTKNPTAEVMAQEFAQRAVDYVQTQTVFVDAVRLWETANNCAEYRVFE